MNHYEPTESPTPKELYKDVCTAYGMAALLAACDFLNTIKEVK